jgi:hypothetical protein
MVAQESIEIFVTAEESSVLEALAQAEAPYSQRAQALLAVDAGSTIEQAARVANLKATQVRYWIGRFRNGRLGVFPDWLIDEMKASASTASAKPKKKKKTKKPKAKAAGSKKGDKNTAKAKSKKGKKAGDGKATKDKKKKGAKKSAKKSIKKKK